MNARNFQFNDKVTREKKKNRFNKLANFMSTKIEIDIN